MDALIERYFKFIELIDKEVTVTMLVAASLVCALSVITFMVIVLGWGV